MVTLTMNPGQDVLRRRPPSMSKQEEAAKFPFYYSFVQSMEEVKAMLRPYVGTEGVFIIRNSFRRPGELTFSVTHNGGLKHFTLLGNPGAYFLHGNAFPTIEALCQYYYENEVPNVENIGRVFLKKPLQTTSNGAGSSGGPQRFSRQASGSTSSSSSGSGGSSVIRRPPARDPVGNHPTSNGFNSIGAHGGLGTPPTPPTQVSRLNPNPAPNAGARATSELPPRAQRMDAGNNNRSRSVSDPRPMEPLPPEAMSGGGERSDPTSSPYYSLPRPLDQDQIPTLIAQLERMPQSGKCQCGLDMEASLMPCGWSIHISQDSVSVGRPFFEGPAQETSWEAPMEVSLALSPEQQDFIRDLYTRWRNKTDHTGAATSTGHDNSSMGGAEGAGQDEVFQ